MQVSDTPPFFFFYRSALHRDLHSFPTRRSSDLDSIASESTMRYHSRVRMRASGTRCASSARSSPNSSSSGSPRSEEHTSELQSPDHLVCRLLLEKKKRETTARVGAEHTRHSGKA